MLQRIDAENRANFTMLSNAVIVGDLQYDTEGIVTVILAFNNARHISQAVESALNQRLSVNHHIWICDDSSADQTPEIIASYTRRFPNSVAGILQKSNRFSRGIRLRQGIYDLIGSRYVANLDADDFWTNPNKLELQRLALDHDLRASFSTHSWDVVDVNGARLGQVLRPGSFRKRLSLMSFAVSNPVYPSSTLIRLSSYRQLITSTDDPPVCQDYELLAGLATVGTIVTLNETLSAYRIHESEFTKSLRRDPQCRPALSATQLAKLGIYKRSLWRLGNVLGELLVRVRFRPEGWARTSTAVAKALLEALDGNFRLR